MAHCVLEDVSITTGYVELTRYLPDGITLESTTQRLPVQSISITSDREYKEQYDTSRESKKLANEIPVRTDYNFKIMTMDMSKETMEKALFSTAIKTTIASSTGETYQIASSLKGNTYRLPDKFIENAVLTTTLPGTTYIEKTDYTIDLRRGTLYILETSTIADASDITLTYDVKASTVEKIVADEFVVQEYEVRFSGSNISENKKELREYVLEKANLKQMAEHMLKTDALDYQNMEFEGRLLTNPCSENEEPYTFTVYKED